MTNEYEYEYECEIVSVMYFTDPRMCSRCQNHGYFEYLVNGTCHRCIVRSIVNACITANIHRGDISLAITQLRSIGF